MRPVRTTVTFSESTFRSKLLHAELREAAFRHQRARLRLSHVHKPEQEAFVTDFSEFVGQTLSIELEDQSIAERDSSGPVVLFAGVLLRSALVYEPGGLQLELEAASGSALLDEVPRTRLFQETTLQGMIDTILGDYQGAALEGTHVELGALAQKPISFAAQWGETDWQFLLRLCSKFGLFLVARNRDLFIHTVNPFEPLAGMDSPIELHLGRDLSSFRLGLRAVNRTVRASSYQHFGEQGLDPGRGEQAEDVRVWLGPSEDTPPASALAQRAASRGGTSPAAGRVVESDDHFSQQEFDAVAARWALARMARMVTGRGESDVLGLGVGALLHIAPGEPRTFEALESDRFLVTSAVHTLHDGVYGVRFQVCAEAAPPLLDPARAGRGGTVRLLSATVAAAHDPSNVGRVRVRLNPFGDDDLTDEIPARCVSEASGEGHGSLNLPEVGDEVLLALEPRSFAAPVVLGSVYNGTSKTLVSNLPGHASVKSSDLTDNNIKYYISKGGTCIIHDTTRGKARLVVATSKVSVVLSEESGVDIHVRGSGAECQVTGTMDGALTLKAKNITLKADQAISFEAGTDIKAEAKSNIKLKANMNYEMEAGMKVVEKSSMMYEVQGGQMMKLQATLININ